MKRTSFRLLIVFAFLISYSSCRDDDPMDIEEVQIGTAYYGNYNASEMFKIPIYDNGLSDAYETIPTGANPYPVDKYGNGKILAITRGENSVTSYDPVSGVTRSIPLEHEPRSSAFSSANGLTLVSGRDKSMTSILDGESVVLTVGENVQAGSVSDFGGGLATGHPMWIDADHFFHIDRHNRVISVFDTNGDLASILNTPTSVHHIVRSGDDFYALCEGNQVAPIAPSILKFKINNNILELVDEFSLPEGTVGAGSMGSHHLDLSPNDTHLYVGSFEGRLFVVDRNTMELVGEISVGVGAGHTTFSSTEDLAIVINHNDIFISVINTSTLSVKKEIVVAESAPIGSAKTIGHTSSFSPDGNSFYLSTPQDGKIVEIDLKALTVKSKLKLTEGANPLQGTFVF